MLRRFGSILFVALVTVLFVEGAKADDECPEFCDRTNAFSVIVPSGWRSIPERWQADPTHPTPKVTLHLHLISPSAATTGANCPVLTTLASSIGDWARMRASMQGVELDLGFWRGVVHRAGFTLVTIKKVQGQEAKGTSRRLLSYVELEFKTPHSGEKTLTARQALYWLPVSDLHPGLPKPDHFKHIPGRVHFVNCTAKTEAFESVRAPFDGVFQSFRPKYCYPVKETSVPVCVSAESNEADKQRVATRSPLDEPAADGRPLSALGETFDEAMVNAAAQVLAAGQR